MAHAQRNLSSNCDDEGRASVFYLIQAVEDMDSKDEEEITEKSDQFCRELGAQSTVKKRKAIHNKHAKQKLPSVLSCQEKCHSSMAN